LPPDIPTAVLRVVERALAKDPAKRWPSARAFAAAARAAAAAPGQQPTSPPVPSQPPPITLTEPSARPLTARRKLSTRALVTASMIVAVLCGAIAAIVNLAGGEEPGTAAPDTTRPAGGDGETTPLSAQPLDPEAVVPAGLLGAWEGWVRTSSGGNEQLRRIVIEQGGIGDQLVTTRTVGDEALCEGTGLLISSDGGVVEVATEVSLSIPESGCTAVGRQTLRLNGSGEAAWESGSLGGVLTRVRESPAAVPEQYLGTWTGTVSSGSHERSKVIVIEDGALGEDLVTATTEDESFYCETNGILVSTEGGVVFFSYEVISDDPPGNCRAVGLQVMVHRDDGSMFWEAEDYSGPLRRSG
jgi:hypothetical protein